jgi:hypothetical protein
MKGGNYYQPSSHLAKLLVSTGTPSKKDPYNLDDHQETDLISDDVTYSTPQPSMPPSHMKHLLKSSSPATLTRPGSRHSPHVHSTAANTPALMLRSSQNTAMSNGNFNAKISAKVNGKPVLPTASMSDINRQSPHHTNHHNLTLGKINYNLGKCNNNSSGEKEYYDNASLAMANNNNNKNIDMINSMNNADFSKMINDQAFRLSDLFNELNPMTNNGNNNKTSFAVNSKPANTSSFVAHANFSGSIPSSASSNSSSPTSSSTQSNAGKTLLIQSSHHHNGAHTFNKFPVPFNGAVNGTLTHTTNRIYNKHHAQQNKSGNIYSKINDYQASFNPSSSSNPSSQHQTKHMNI